MVSFFSFLWFPLHLCEWKSTNQNCTEQWTFNNCTKIFIKYNTNNQCTWIAWKTHTFNAKSSLAVITVTVNEVWTNFRILFLVITAFKCTLISYWSHYQHTLFCQHCNSKMCQGGKHKWQALGPKHPLTIPSTTLLKRRKNINHPLSLNSIRPHSSVADNFFLKVS